jgi:hypothetical protein
MCAWASFATKAQNRPEISGSLGETGTISVPVHRWSQGNNGMRNADSTIVRLDVRAPRKSSRIRTEKELVVLRLCMLTAAIALSMTFGCATPHAILDVAAPSKATAGLPFTVTVNVMYDGKRDTIINSYISFSSSDPAAILPSVYTFTPADAGSHTWTNGFTLMTPGNQTISASIFDASGINGSATVTVSP